MKILAADYTRYLPRERLVERVRYGIGFVSEKTRNNTGGAFFLTEYKGDGILSILDTIVPIVGTVANVVAKGANIYKELRGGGIEPEALAEVLKAEDTKQATSTYKESAVDGGEPKASLLSETKTGKGFFYIHLK